MADRGIDAAGAGEPLAGDEGALFDLLLEALKELGDADRADRASRLAASAYVRLRRRDPEAAQRINVLMHRLAARL